jgi:hypothetical protein
MACILPDLRTMALSKATRSLLVREDMAIETAILPWIDPTTITRVIAPDRGVEAAARITIAGDTWPRHLRPHLDMNRLGQSLNMFDIIPPVGISHPHP